MNSAIETAIRKVGAVDKRIDAVRAELIRNETVDEMDCGSWQRAWDRHPVLRAIERSLFIRRADAADCRDGLIAKQAKADERRANRAYAKAHVLKRCPTCGIAA